MNILFICRHNRFRSKVAEAIFNKLNRINKQKNKARSRGIIKDIDVAETVVDALRERGIKLKSKKSIKLKKRDILWADIIVNVADNADFSEYKKYLKKKKILKWRISDVDQSNVKGIRKRVVMIEKKVSNLLILLENKKV